MAGFAGAGDLAEFGDDFPAFPPPPVAAANSEALRRNSPAIASNPFQSVQITGSASLGCLSLPSGTGPASEAHGPL